MRLVSATTASPLAGAAAIACSARGRDVGDARRRVCGGGAVAAAAAQS